jgi:hypothetical protein
MDPTTTFCPNQNCPARGQTGQGNIGIHSQKEQRFICHACHQTFSARKGTVFYRLRRAVRPDSADSGPGRTDDDCGVTLWLQLALTPFAYH